jgi:hypothetical protein
MNSQTKEVMQMAKAALSAMLTHMGMDEDDWNKPTFDQARKAEAAIDEALEQSQGEHPPSRHCECAKCVEYFGDSVCESSFHPETWKPQEPPPVPDVVKRVLRFAGKTRRQVSNPCLTANDCIELADWMVANHRANENCECNYCLNHFTPPSVEAAVEATKEKAAKVCGEFAQKWWSLHCDTNKHMETTLKAHNDFCTLQSAIRGMK